MAELAPWRVRCTVVSVSHNLGMALLGGTTPLMAAWLLSRTGKPLAPAVYLSAAGAVSFVAALLLPRTARHRMTKEFQAARPRGSRHFTRLSAHPLAAIAPHRLRAVAPNKVRL